jgi:peptide/nickel transport system substrate-binding protein
VPDKPQRRIQRRRAFLQSGALSLGAAALLSCSRSTDSRGASVLRVGAGADRYNTSPGRFTFTSSRPNVHVAEPPVRPDDAFHAQPWLFERWSYEGRGNYVAHLRPGVLFHDGTALTSDVFISSAKRFIAARDFIALDPDSLRRVDAGTVAFRSNSGSASMIKNMTHPAASLFLANGQEESMPVGTGPYKLVRYEPRRLLEVERFDRYWGPTPPSQRVSIRFLADPQARLMALRAGEIDLISDVVPELFQGLAPDERSVVVRKSRPMRYVALLCNRRGSPPFDTLSDIRVRRALALAIDRDAIASVMYGGHAVPARGVLPGWMFGLGDESPRGFDTDRRKAASLLDDAGWRLGEGGIRSKQGRALQLRLVSAFPNASAVKPMPEMLEQMFRAIGAKVEIVEVEDDQLYYTGYADGGQGDMFLEMGGNAVADPTFLLYNTYHSKTPWPAYRFSAPGADVDDLLDAARQQSDDQAIISIVREAHRRIIDEHVSSIPILMVPVFLLTRPDIVLQPFENLDWVDFGAARRKA